MTAKSRESDIGHRQTGTRPTAHILRGRDVEWLLAEPNAHGRNVILTPPSSVDQSSDVTRRAVSSWRSSIAAVDLVVCLEVLGWSIGNLRIARA